MLGLKLCADNLVGGELLKGISGGEKRRLTLAEALLSDVSVLYADEPLRCVSILCSRKLSWLSGRGRTADLTPTQR